jgi:type IV secretion system protein VirB4
VLSVISASTDNIEIMHDIMQQVSAANDIATDDLQPEHWLKIFYENRKGSGKAKPNPSQTARATLGKSVIHSA